jgi:hypothetical protein
MKIPGPDHPITITPFQGRVTVRFNNVVVAQTYKAVKLEEANYPAVFLSRDPTFGLNITRAPNIKLIAPTRVTPIISA